MDYFIQRTGEKKRWLSLKGKPWVCLFAQGGSDEAKVEKLSLDPNVGCTCISVCVSCVFYVLCVNLCEYACAYFCMYVFLYMLVHIFI